MKHGAKDRPNTRNILNTLCVLNTVRALCIYAALHEVTLRSGAWLCGVNRTCSEKTETHKRLKRTLFIRTKTQSAMFGVIPFIRLQNDT